MAWLKRLLLSMLVLWPSSVRYGIQRMWNMDTGRPSTSGHMIRVNSYERDGSFSCILKSNNLLYLCPW